jgi:hypothetical protein
MLAYQISPVTIHDYPEFLASIAGGDSSRLKPIKLPKPVAPFDRNPATAAQACFDRDTGILVPIEVLKTYKDALAQYHLRPEHKFLNGNYTDRGPTKRRHVQPTAVRNIGKESNRWEERFYLGRLSAGDCGLQRVRRMNGGAHRRMRTRLYSHIPC